MYLVVCRSHSDPSAWVIDAKDKNLKVARNVALGFIERFQIPYFIVDEDTKEVFDVL